MITSHIVFFRACSYEIADIVADILNLSFASGTVPKQWLSAVVTPVPKPKTLSDYRPISVTPLLSRLAEKLVVSRWLMPAIPSCTLDDQYHLCLDMFTTSCHENA